MTDTTRGSTPKRTAEQVPTTRCPTCGRTPEPGTPDEVVALQKRLQRVLDRLEMLERELAAARLPRSQLRAEHPAAQQEAPAGSPGVTSVRFMGLEARVVMAVRNSSLARKVVILHHRLQRDRWERREELLDPGDSWFIVTAVTGDRVLVECESVVEAWIGDKRIAEAHVQYFEGRILAAKPTVVAQADRGSGSTFQPERERQT